MRSCATHSRAISASSSGRQHHAGGVVRRVEQHQARAGPDGVGQPVEVGPERRRAEGDRHADASGERDRRCVRVVVRLEGHHLVARLAQREHRGGDRLGGPGRDQHLGVGVEVEPIVRCWWAAMAPRSSGTPMAGGYWLRPSRMASMATSRTLGPVGVGEPLPEVDGTGRGGERRHLAEDGRAETPRPCREQIPAAGGSSPRRVGAVMTERSPVTALMGRLDNPVWHALAGPQATLAEGSGRASRFRSEVSVFAAVPDDATARGVVGSRRPDRCWGSGGALPSHARPAARLDERAPAADRADGVGRPGAGARGPGPPGRGARAKPTSTT